MFFLIADKIELALAAVIAPAVSGPQIVTGKSFTDKQRPPIIVCGAEEDGDEEPKGSGNFFVNAKVEIKTGAVANEEGTDDPSDPKNDNQLLIAAVFGAVRVENLADLLTNAVPDLTVFPASIIFQAPERFRDEHGVWNDTLPFRCLACGRSLAP